MSPPILDPIRGALLRSQPDGRLVALAREGRERPLEEIVRRYRAPLVAFAAMFVPAHRADDVVQESLLRAFDALRSSDAEIHLRPWLFRIVRNQALNDLRDTPMHDELTAELEGVASPQEIAERREEVAAIIGGLHALPAAQREAIIARELEGRGHSEIAAELGTSPGAVRQLIFRARTTLRSAAGLLIPLPLLRLLLGPGGAEAAGAATSAGVAAATAGGGAATGAAGKVAVGLAGVALAVGGGVAAERGREGPGDRIASADGTEVGAGPVIGGPGRGGGGDEGPGAGGGGGPRSSGPSGHGGDGGAGSGSGGRGGGDSGGSGSSGPGDGGSGSSGGGSSGSGSGEDFDDGAFEQDDLQPPELDDDPDTSGSSGSGASASGASGSGIPGSGTSGSGISGSGTSGSGTSGSGTSGSGTSGSGTSGSGSSGSGSSGSRSADFDPS